MSMTFRVTIKDWKRDASEEVEMQNELTAAILQRHDEGPHMSLVEQFQCPLLIIIHKAKTATWTSSQLIPSYRRQNPPLLMKQRSESTANQKHLWSNPRRAILSLCVSRV
jgi:hypothetical protein